MAKVTLGGDRLGSGKKMEITLPGFERSTHDQGFVFTTDTTFGVLVPAMCNIGTRGDVFYINDITSLVRTLPTNSPVFGSVKMQVDVFAAPLRLYIGALHNNATGIGLKMEQIKLPVEKHITTVYQKDLELANPNIASVAPTSFSHYIGQKGSKTGTNYANNSYNTQALFKLMYWDVYKNYYANKQEEEGVVIKGVQVDAAIPWTEMDVVDNDDNIVKLFPSNNKISEADSDVSMAFIWEEYPIAISFPEPVPWTTVAKLTLKTKAGDYTPMQDLDKGTPRWQLISKDPNNPNIAAGWEIRKTSISTVTAPASKYVIDSTIENVVEFQGEKQKQEVVMQRFPLKNIDKMREKILAAPIGTPLIVNEDKTDQGVPYNVETVTTLDSDGYIRETRSQSLCGLAVKTHLSDIFNNWLQTDWIDGENGIAQLTAIDTSSGNFTINEFILDYKLFRMMNKIAVSDGSYDAWQTAVYGEEGRVITESPIYCGGYSTEVAFDEVVSNSASNANGYEPLGSLAGRGSQQNATRKGGRDIKIKCDEATLIMVLVSFTPRTTYCQNEAWWNDLESMDDLHKPDLDGIAFQNLPAGWFTAWADTVNGDGTVTRKSIGKQPSWTEYTTAVNETHGSFVTGGELQHMVFNRSYQADDGTTSLVNATSYIDPTEFNIVFADQQLTALPFWVQIGMDVSSRRKMAANQMPLL